MEHEVHGDGSASSALGELAWSCGAVGAVRSRKKSSVVMSPKRASLAPSMSVTPRAMDSASTEGSAGACGRAAGCAEAIDAASAVAAEPSAIRRIRDRLLGTLGGVRATIRR